MENEVKKKVPVWAWFMVLPIAIGGYFLYTHFRKKQEDLSNKMKDVRAARETKKLLENEVYQTDN